MPRDRPTLWTLFGADFRVDIVSVALLLPLAWTLGSMVFPVLAPELPASSYWWMAAGGTAGFVLSLVVRSVAPVLAARSLNVPVAATTLFIFGASVETRSEKTRPGAEALMAAASFLASLALGVVFFLIFTHGFGDAPPLVFIGVAFFLALTNWALGVFYLLPGYPLDGGRLLRAALAARRKDMGWATRIAMIAGAAVALLVCAVGVYLLARAQFIAGLWLVLAGMLLLRALTIVRRDRGASPE